MKKAVVALFVTFYCRLTHAGDSVDFGLLWEACTDQKSNITYCHQLDDFKNRQLRLLELFFAEHTTDWEKTALTIIYYGASGKIPIEYKLTDKIHWNTFIKWDEVSTQLVIDF